MLPRAPAPPWPHKGPSPWQPRGPGRSADLGPGAIEPRRRTCRYRGGGARLRGRPRRWGASLLAPRLPPAALGARGPAAAAAPGRTARASVAVRGSVQLGHGRSRPVLVRESGGACGGGESRPGLAGGRRARARSRLPNRSGDAWVSCGSRPSSPPILSRLRDPGARRESPCCARAPGPHPTHPAAAPGG